MFPEEICQLRSCTVNPVAEVSIGHALIADALELGLAATVHEYLAAIARANENEAGDE